MRFFFRVDLSLRSSAISCPIRVPTLRCMQTRAIKKKYGVTYGDELKKLVTDAFGAPKN